MHFDRIFGIDYSGSLHAGKKIWVCEAERISDRIQINDLYSVHGRFHIKTRKEANLKILELIENNPQSLFGFDFPFSIPHQAMPVKEWETYILAFNTYYQDENDFRRYLRFFFNGRDVKRPCDIESKAPFSPYNLRIYRQTFFGISEILKPLLQTTNIFALPFQKPVEGKSVVMEVCPASLLKKMGKAGKLFYGYKGRYDAQQKMRLDMLDLISREYKLGFSEKKFRQMVADNQEGDALDSILCAICAINGISSIHRSGYPEHTALEGWIYY